jgi:cell fate (sporulation/competence/biofilm development) regulator YmcA (YheA/YmcA/DUF963 family)
MCVQCEVSICEVLIVESENNPTETHEEIQISKNIATEPVIDCFHTEQLDGSSVVTYTGSSIV